MRRTAFQPTIRSFSASQQSCAAAPQLRLRSRLLALADGWRSPFPVKFVSRQDAPFLIKEVVEDRWYLRRGVELQPGDCVLDVGANVGLFALQAAELVGSKGRVICLEPEPKAYGALLQNLLSYQQRNGKAGNTAQLVPIHAAAGNGDQSVMQLTSYRQSGAWSTTCPDEEEVQEGMRHLLNNALPGMRGIEPSLLSRLAQLLRRLAPRQVYEAAWRIYVGGMLGDKEVVDCPVRTLSEVMAQEALDRVHLLKIDVERAELDVLAGLGPGDWAKVQQLVVEVHDMKGRVQHMEAMLTGFGFHVAVDQAADLLGSSLYTLYCVRQARR